MPPPATEPSTRTRGRKPTLELLPAGTRLGRYELIRRFASGGMAELYLARSGGISGFEKIVALKRILPQYAGQEDFVQMFLDEARLTATIQHNNVAQVYDIGQCDDGLFFTMEYVHGADLRSVLQTLSKRGVVMPLGDALTITIGAAAGLHAAHERTTTDGRPQGIIHRDITPSNVLVSFDGCVKLIDFGIAKAERRTTETRAGTLKGKIAYMSPEQCQGEPLDRRSDVFSLGIVLFEATTGTRLFAADNEYAALRQIVDQDAPRPSTRRADYPPVLEEIVLKALRRDREDRYATAQALQVDLEEFARASGLAISTAHLGKWMRDLFPERAAEPLVDDRRIPLPLTVPLSAPTRALVVSPRGTGRNPAINDNEQNEPDDGDGDGVPNLADELEPSISIQQPSSVGPEPTSAALSSVSAQLVLLHRQRRTHLVVLIGLAAAIAAIVAIAVALVMAGKGQGQEAANAAAAVVVPAPTTPTPSPSSTSPSTSPSPSTTTTTTTATTTATATATSNGAGGEFSRVPDALRVPERDRAAVESRGARTETKIRRSEKPRKTKSRKWNPDSALPPM